MARLGPVKLGLALVLVFSATLDKATSDDKCRTGCGGVTPHDFRYVEGTTYKYTYEGNIDITLSSAEGQHSTTKVRANVLLTQLGQCNQILRIQNLQVIGSDSKKYTNIDDISKPVKLNFHDGHVEDIICADAGDTQNSLNIKRAIASLFQATPKHNYETDVFGVCPTEFSTHKEGNVFVVKKSRNLNKCAHRESLANDFLATAFNLNSEIKTSPLLKGDYSSEQRVKNGILDHVIVTENYLFVPFSVGSNGAKAQVQSKLSLAGQSKEKINANVNTPKSILFENPHPIYSDTTNVNSVLKALKDTADAIDITVKETSANKFSNLIQVLRVAKKADLLTVYNQVRAGAGFNDKTEAKRIFLDALFRAGTGDAIEVAIDLYQKKQLSEIETKLFFLGLSFVKHVTPNALKAAAGLVNAPDLPREAFLGIGALVSRYCRAHSCKNLDELNDLLGALLSKINVRNVGDRNSENTVIAALKALSNTKHIPDNLVPKIVALAQDKNGPIRIRVAALEAYLGNPCSDKFRDSALNILKDIQQDSEIRIKAYLALVQCPNGKVANALKRILEDEPSYQVGGFIASHLRTLKTSANPDKALAKAQLEQITTTKNFPFDIRKYSYNAEVSYAFDTLGLGSYTESNIIYSQKSFLPRSTSLNLTAELFGHTVNFLEVDLRQENLEKVLEYYLGPLGVLRKESPAGLFVQGKSGLKKILDQVATRASAARQKREVPKAQLDYISRQLQSDKQNELNKDLDLDISVKLFGSEALFLSLNEDSRKYTPEVIIDKIFDVIDEKIVDAKNFDEVVRSNAVFLDAEVAYPTSLGFPLRLEVEGASTLQIKTAGNIDLKSILSEQDTKLKLSLIPSVNIQISSRFTLDAAVVQSGLKVVANLHSATGGSLDLEVTNGGEGYDVKFSLPVDKQQIITASHDLVFEKRELGGSEVDTRIKFTQSKDFSVCVDHLSPLIGVTFCADINQPNVATEHGPTLPYPLNGNSKFGVYIEKNDLSYYHFKGRQYIEANKLGIEASFQAIGKQNNKKVTLNTDIFLKPDIFFQATLESDVKKAVLEGRVVNSNKEKSAFLKFGLDNIVYYGKIGALVSGSLKRQIYEPIIEYKAGQDLLQKPPYNVEGQIIVEPHGENTKYTFNNIKLIVPGQKPITINGNAGCEPKTIYADLTLSDGEKSGTFKGRLQAQYDDIKLNAELQNNINPQANFNIKYEYKSEDNNVRSDLQVIHGRDLSAKQNLFKLSNSFKNVETKVGNEYATKHHLSYPPIGIDSKFDLEAKPNNLKYDVDLTYKKIKLGSELDIKLNKKSDGDYEVEFEIYGFDNKLEIDLEREVNGYKSKVNNKVVVNGKALEVAGTVNHLIQEEKIHIGSDLVIKLTGHSDLKYHSSYKYVPGDLDVVVKLTSGGTVYIDALLKVDKSHNGNGNLKINFKDILLVNGQLKTTKGSGSSSLLIELPKFQRKIKEETSFTINDPTYNFEVTLYTNFEKDNSQKYTVSTQNQIKSDSLDTRNVVDLLGQKLETNFKGSYKGEFFNGRQQYEFDVTLPTQHYLAGKFDRDVKTVNDLRSGQLSGSLEQRDNKNKPGRKLTVKASGNVNLREILYDLTYNLAADSSSGQNVNVDLVLNKKKQGDKNIVNYNVKTYGSLLPEPLEANLNGKYNIDETRKSPSTGDITVELKIPNSKIKTAKFNVAGSVLVPESETDIVDIKVTSGFFIDDDGTEKGATFDIKTDGEIKLGVHNGQIKGTFHSAKQDPIILSAGYNHENTKGASKCHNDISLQYARDKTITGSLTVNRPSPNEIDFNGEIALTANGNKYVFNALVLSEPKPAFDFELKYPNGKVDKLAGKVSKIGEKSFAGELTVVNNAKNFEFDGSIDVNAEDIDDFSLKLTANSPALKLDKIVLQANTKEAKGAKKIQISAKAADKNILSGATTYKTRDEGGKFVIEGSGNFKVKDESKSGNFKYIRQNIDTALEKGIEISLDAALGNKAIDAEFKSTNKQFRILNSYCEEKKQCAHLEIDAKTNYQDLDHYSNVVEVNVDLRKLGLSHELGLKAVTNRKGFALDHTVDVHFQSQENKYQYSLYLHPTNTGISLTTPKRVVSLEAKVNVPQSGQKGPINGEILLYLNKKTEPNKKTALTFVLDSQGGDKAGKVSLKTALSHPALKKPLSINYDAQYDIETKKSEISAIIDVLPSAREIKVVAKSQGIVKAGYGIKFNLLVDIEPVNYKLIAEENLHIEYQQKYALKYGLSAISILGSEKVENAVSLGADPQHAYYQLKLNSKEILGIKSNFQLSKEVQIVDTQLTGIGIQPISSHLEIKNFNSLSYSVYKTATPNNKLQVSSALIPGQIVDFRVFANKGGQKIDLVHAFVKLDEADFLKSDYAVKKENIKQHLYVPVKETAENFAKETNAEFSKSVEDAKRRITTVNEHLKQGIPDLKPVTQYYVSELTKLKEEVVADKSIKELSEALSNIIGAFAQAVSELLTKLSNTLEQISETLRTKYESIAESLQKDLLPKLKELGDQLAAVVVSVFESVSKVVLAISEQISTFLDSHQAEFKQLAASLSEVGHDLGRFLAKTFDQVKTTLTAELNKLIEELKALPIYEEITNTIRQLAEGLPLPEDVIETFKNAAGAIKDLVGLEEIKQFIDVTTDYIEKKLRGQAVNDIQELEKIVRALVVAVKTFWAQIEQNEAIKTAVGAPGVANFAYSIPKLVAAKFSPLNRILTGEFPDLETLLYSVDFNPRSLILPLRLHGIIIQGQHIFTFDGKHLTFPGKCNYLLARDTVNGNFTIVGTYTNGLLTAITVADKADTITIRKNAQVLLNNAATEYPVRRPLIDAYRTYEGVHIVAKAGASVDCAEDLGGCVITISGFYHGQLKGLLGNGNNEPYDDYTLPNGKIVTSESDFGNAYKLQNNCPAVKTVDHSAHHHAESCTKLFSEDYDLSLCYSFVNPANFRQACDHGVAAGVPDTEKYLAAGYVAACRLKFIPADLPEKYVTCENGDEKRKLGDTFSVKTPQKSADIVIAVDVVKSNEPTYKDLVVGVAQNLIKELSDRGIKDVQFHVITYGGDNQKYPSHITTNGGKLSFKGKLPVLKFSEQPDEDDSLGDLELGHEFLNFIIALLPGVSHDINLVLGNTVQAKAYEEGIKYPFRANAIKTLIAVTGSPCEEGSLSLLQMLRAYLLYDDTISLQLITPMNENFKIKDEKTKKSVIGFNANSILTIPECKRKPLGNDELRGELKYEDYCVDFTLEGGGNVFVSDNFETAKGPNRRLFVSITAYNIAEALAREEKSLDCECERAGPFNGQNKCSLVKLTKKPPTGKKAIMRG